MTDPRRARPRRGLAMLLVLIALGMATILTTAYLASRDNSTIVSANVTSTAEARWAALAGLELTMAVLETESDWRTRHDRGRLIDDYDLAGASIDVDLVDLATGDPPTEKSSDIQVKVTAVSNGVTQRAVARATVKGDPVERGVDVDLSEFAIFTRDGIEIRESATLSRWLSSPLGDDGRRIAVGTRANGAGTLDIDGAAVAVDTTVYHGPGASASLVLNAGPAVQTVELSDFIPLPAPPPPPALSLSADPSQLLTAQITTLSGETHLEQLSLASGTVVTLAHGSLLATTNGLFASGSTIDVAGDVTIVVGGDVGFDTSSIRLADDARLTMYVVGAVTLQDTYVGEAFDGAMPYDSTGHAAWMDPARIRVYGVSGTPVQWDLRGQTMVKGSLYSNAADVRIRENAIVYGRVAAGSVELRDDAALYYDHTLDKGNGYTNLDSYIYDADAAMKTEIATLASLEDATLAELSTSLGTAVWNEDDSYGDTTEDATSGKTNTSLVSGPTPRPVRVAFELKCLGADVCTWESKARTTTTNADGTATTAETTAPTR